MDNLLDKDIFNDKDLNVLSPDYNLCNLSLRMQIRKNLFSDTHRHNEFKNINSQRKITKRSKDNYKINKEIVKIRSNFNEINMKNRIMLKNGIKHNNSRAIHKNDDHTIHHKNDGHMIPDLKTMGAVLCEEHIASDHNYSLINDEVIQVRSSVIGIFKSKLQTNNETSSVQKMINENNDIIENSHTTNIPKKNGSKSLSINLNNHKENNKFEINTTDSQDSELQKLLIMMAIATKPDSDAENYTTPNIAISNGVVEANPNSIFLSSNSVHCENISEILNITPLKMDISRREKYLLKKYLELWRDFLERKREYLLQERQTTINSFFDKLSRKKSNLNQLQETMNKSKHQAQDFSTYQHRYKMQKHIIAIQKAKLEEQHRLIEELKYNRIVEASRNSVDTIKEEVRKAYFELDRHLKPKIKVLTNELNITDIQEPSLVLHCLKVPQFLQRMEKRAREREEKHALIRERRRQMEEERVRLKQQAEVAKTEMDKEEKMKRIKELRQKRRKEKIEGIRKKQYAEKMRALIVMADLYYEKCLMSKYGIRPFLVLLEIKRDNIEKAKMHYKFQLKKNVFLNWMWYTEDMWFERNYKAEDFYRKKIFTSDFSGF